MDAQPEQNANSANQPSESTSSTPKEPATVQPMVVATAAADAPGRVVLETTLPDTRGSAVSRSAFVQVTEHYIQSPYPPPQLLKEYNEAIPGLANRLIEIVEKESAHRQGIENAQLQADIQDRRDGREIERRGQNFGFWIGTIAIVVGGMV